MRREPVALEKSGWIITVQDGAVYRWEGRLHPPGCAWWLPSIRLVPDTKASLELLSPVLHAIRVRLTAGNKAPSQSWLPGSLLLSPLQLSPAASPVHPLEGVRWQLDFNPKWNERLWSPPGI